MKVIGLIVNIQKDKAFIAVNIILNWSNAKGVKIIMFEEIGIQNNTVELVDDETFFKNSEIVIVVGGDGTVLRHAEKIALNGIPMLGINCGTLGYLTLVDKKEIVETLNNVLNSNYEIANHSLITSKIGDSSFNSLNEISIKSTIGKIINLSVYINCVYIHTFRSDGILICTPTGSTAYNLSSGGPMIMNDANVFCLTPICPHQLFARPIIINDNSNIKIVMEKCSSTSVEIVSDGELYKSIEKSFTIEVNKTDFMLKVINPFEVSFYEILLEKLVGINKKYE